MRTLFGMIHGRFQPFHNGHLKYALGALARCDHLIVGITNPDPSTIVAEEADPERHRPEANPFTYFERQQMVRAALTDREVNPRRFSVVPFPIHYPERWPAYVPQDTVQFIRVFSPWGRQKLSRFADAGWPVEILDAGAAKEISGREVRRALAEGAGWESLVPAGVASVLRDVDACSRLHRLLP